MKRLLPLLLLSGCSAEPEDPSLPKWSDSQIASLKAWAAAAPRDALPVFDVSELDRTASRWNDVPQRRAATALAERLASAHLHGCAPPGEKGGWLIEDADDGKDLRTRLAAALSASDRLDGFFAGLRPAHPQYAALLKAYGAERDPARRTTIARNMERWRWMPRELGEDYVFVNVPEFEVGLWREGALADTWRAVVGKTSTPTPVLAATISGVTFNPWWEVPASIVRENGGRMGRGYVQTKSGRYRQAPGPRNALGKMKVEMLNPHAIYLHDTPSRGLFGAAYRAYSHGCVRVSDAIGFAATLLSGVRSREEIDVLAGIKTAEEIAMEKLARAGRPMPKLSLPPQGRIEPAPIKTANVALGEKLPVYIAYFTAAAGKDGALIFPRDLYRRDDTITDPANPDRQCWGPAGKASRLRYHVEGEDDREPKPEEGKGEDRKWTKKTLKAKPRL